MQEESWKEYPQDARYEVSSLGSVRNAQTGRVRKLVPIKNGYLTVMFSSPMILRYVHAMVLETFVGPRPIGMEASHLNGDRRDNRVENLVWELRKENLHRKKGHGTEPLGESRWSSKLTAAQAIWVKECGLSQAAVANQLGVSRGQVYRIRRGLNWRHI